MQGKLQHCLLVIIGLFMCQSALFSQKSLVKAKRQFELKAFDLAIENAKKALDTNPDCVDCHYVIAESFRLMNQNVDAAIWYRKMEKFNSLPESYDFNYGQLLKKMGQYDQAKEHFDAYREKDAILAEHYSESCDFAKALLSEEIDFELNLYEASSRNTEFGPAIYKNKLVYASFRDDFIRDIDKLNKSHISPDGPQMFISDLESHSTYDDVDLLLSDKEESFDMGPVHYAFNAPLCAITKNNFRDGEQQIFTNDLELSLFLAETKPDGSFSKIKAYPYNEVGYASGFGTLNPFGDILYFASNRPGGYGGFDIYVSYLRNGTWTYPENLGPRVNSPGNEVTPFFDGKTLYFSSDYHKGLGGQDVFSSYIKSGVWQVPANMGNGINSPEDDFYFIKHAEKPSYYLTSNRLGGKGSYDIYQINTSSEEDLIHELSYEDVVPAEVNINKDFIDASNTEAIATAVKMEEESIIEEYSDPEKLTSLAGLDYTRTAEDFETRMTISSTLLNKNESDMKSVDFEALYPSHFSEEASTIAAGLDLTDAKRIALGDLILRKETVCFIQLAALFRNDGNNVDNYMPLRQFGSIYKIKYTNGIKLKLGYFIDESEAKEILNKVRAMGYNDAFITCEVLNTAKMELIEVSEATANAYDIEKIRSTSTTGVNYKVRLASYQDPVWFDVDAVKDVGIIEQWTKEQWSIFVLSGFDSRDQATKAMLIAKNRGFKDAELVLDRNGILEKIR